MADRNIILIGFMGTGKSVTGKVLAETCGLSFADSDNEIERAEGTTIPAIFAEYGEDYFRKKETEALMRLLSGTGQVISTGGGAVLSPANREAMLRGGFVAALTARAETIIARVGHDSNRPLLQGDRENKVRELLEARKTAYQFAHITIETDGLSHLEVAEEIRRAYLHYEKS